MNLQLIKNYSENRPGGLRRLAEDVGMSEPNLHRCIRINKIQASDLEKIAKALNVPISYFFDEPTDKPAMAGDHNQYNEHHAHDNYNGNADAVLSERVKSLEALVDEKNERISELKERIEELKR